MLQKADFLFRVHVAKLRNHDYKALRAMKLRMKCFYDSHNCKLLQLRTSSQHESVQFARSDLIRVNC